MAPRAPPIASLGPPAGLSASAPLGRTCARPLLGPTLYGVLAALFACCGRRSSRPHQAVGSVRALLGHDGLAQSPLGRLRGRGGLGRSAPLYLKILPHDFTDIPRAILTCENKLRVGVAREVLIFRYASHARHPVRALVLQMTLLSASIIRKALAARI